MEKYQPFLKAVPVWAAGRQKEMNVTCRFTAAIAKSDAPVILRMAGYTKYRVFVNGKIAACGPARGPKFFFRVDEVPLNDFLTMEENIVLCEVAGYNINCYDTFDQPSFFCAEILEDGTPAVWTSPDISVGGMPCDVVTERVQKVQKFSFQRPFMEVWRLGKSYADSFGRMTEGRTPLEDCGEKTYLPRRVPFATLAKLEPISVIGAGKVTVSDKPSFVYRSRELTNIDPKIQKGYPMDELEVTISEDAGCLGFIPANLAEGPVPAEYQLEAEHSVTYRLSSNLTGFIGAHLCTETHATVLLTFDELYENGDTNLWHNSCCNIVRIELKPGEYDFLSMEPYTMQYIKVIALDGAVTVSDVHLIEYSAPNDNFMEYRTNDDAFRKIWDAAAQSYRQNAVDLFTDCPCRERAGWLCDSFWTARTEYALTGKSVVEKNFLENFLLPDSFKCLPEGMFPMSYPSDHYNGEYIPNWAMWLVMELREYWDRSGDRDMIDAYREKIYKLFAFFNKYRNVDGLLDRLDSWIFVEWSKANELVRDVNFPTNMLYAACLQAAGEMYGDEALIADAAKMKATIRRLSFNGKFFTDRMVRNEEGKLVNTDEITEVCQYYAFYCGTASPADYPELWETLLHDFGPDRKKNNKYPEVYFANAFIGNYLRLDMMARNGNLKEVLDNIRGYFLKMAEMTGTLWEYDSTSASVNHGFASHVIVWLKQAAELGL